MCIARTLKLGLVTNLKLVRKFESYKKELSGTSIGLILLKYYLADKIQVPVCGNRIGQDWVQKQRM